jgi:hypothetical protein
MSASLIAVWGQALSDYPHHSVDVARGLVLLFEIGTGPLYGVFVVKEFARAAKLSLVGFLV